MSEAKMYNFSLAGAADSADTDYYSIMLRSSYSYNSLGSRDLVANDSNSQHISSSRGGAKKLSMTKVSMAAPAKYTVGRGEERRRMKVSIRCRPAFADEVSAFRGKYFPIVSTRGGEEGGKSASGKYGVVQLRQVSGKTRDFYYDNVFGEGSSQLEVYESVARPVVEDVLRGFNGTIFAYGQTGSGKTYSMGILATVRSPQAGIIPRALQQLFEYRQSVRGESKVRVVLSFLQIYRETIQDLLGGDCAGTSLPIREDRQAGFYVEGLTMHEVGTAEEAFGLLNLGLENRAIASTHMNSTSSRSHTILTLSVSQAPLGGGPTVTSKLLLVDLAGSERVRQSASRGARLSEAKSINSSLSALGNVISALGDCKSKSGHIPYRDSKLTRLLQDSLGGTAATSLICTVGPSPANYGETLGSLQFATRCMAVVATPVRHETIDYADLCTSLQDRLNSVEGRLKSRFLQQQRRYEEDIRLLQEQLRRASNSSGGSNGDNGSREEAAARADPDPALEHVLAALSKHGSREQLSGWLQDLQRGDGAGGCNVELVAMLSYCYSALRILSASSLDIVEADRRREAQHQFEDVAAATWDGSHDEAVRAAEAERLLLNDPLRAREGLSAPALNGHLSQLSRGAAWAEAARRFSSGGGSTSGVAQVEGRDNFYDYANVVDLASAINGFFTGAQANFEAASRALRARHETVLSMTSELAECYFDRRSRDEEVVNWSYILKYLLSSNSNLKRELRAAAGSPPKPEPERPRRRSQFIDMSDAIYHNTQGFAELQAESDAYETEPSEDQEEYEDDDKDTLEGIMETLEIYGGDERRAARNVILKVLGMSERDIAAVADPDTRQQINAIRGAVRRGSPLPSPPSAQQPLPAYLVDAPLRRLSRLADRRADLL